MMITITHKGNFSKTEKFLKKGFNRDYLTILEKYGREGVAALANATPIDSGETANSWGYKIDHYNGGATISWTNTSIVNGVSIAVLIQYGHGTRNGGYVQGRDYINPAIRPIFDKIANELWREVSM
jgi:hypothetical protein